MSGTIAIDKISTSELKLQKILTASSTAPTPGSVHFRKWFLQQFNQRGQNDGDCTVESFALYFFNGVRQQTYIHLRTMEVIENPCLKTSRNVVKAESGSNLDTNVRATTGLQQLQICSFPVLETPSGRGFIQVLPRNTSTPAKRSLNHSQHQLQPQQQQQQKQGTQNPRRSTDSFGTTPNKSSFEKSRNSTGDGSIGSNSFCLGDFLISPTVSNRQSNAQKKKTQSGTTSTPNSNNSSSKPKKRVVPLCVSKTTSSAIQDSGQFGANSSFSQENNILVLSQTEVKEFNKRSVAEARKALKNDLSEVSSVIKASTPASTPIKIRTSISDVTQSVQKVAKECSQQSNIEGEFLLEPIAFEKIPNKTSKQLKMLACIYGLLLDMNLTTNILHEFSFLLNLLNANTSTTQPLTYEDEDFIPQTPHTLELLKEAINSIFFAICVLEEQQHTLALADIKSLGVVLQCERLICLSPTLKASLSAVYAQKQTFSNVAAAHDISLGGFKNVCFQEDSDSRKFFHTNNEFGAFKTQRDLFYGALKLWEKHHLYPSWNFTIEVSPKVREIFRQSENPVNMTHFAKLFVSQLLISSTEQTSPEEVGIDIEMDGVDLEKFNKLSQRLIAPSNFSVDYQFPREQAFFRDFIIESRSIPFMEHLKIVLFSELATLNDSTFEQINLIAEDGYRECDKESEFIVRPPVLGSMLILAKFLGFVIALPFQGSSNNEAHSVIIQSHQLRLRRLFQPPVNICHLLDSAIANGRHLVTLPWIVQYLAMLDDVTLQLDSFVETTHRLYDLYTSLGNGELQITPTSVFIVRCCLGWLFEQKPVIGAEYLNYRVTHDSKSKKKTGFKCQNAQIKADLQVAKPILDSILCVACPFLAEFRVSIMPAKHAMAKYVSRSGRFRHITPCIAEPSRLSEQQVNQLHQSSSLNKPPTTPESTSKNRQKILMESFLHAQNSSMQRLIVFLSERVYKCVVKDAQCKILLPSKAAADKQVNEITSSNKTIVLEQVKTIYQQARNETHKQWDIEVPRMLNERTVHGLEALLPIETAPIIKKAYAGRIRIAAKLKIEQWRHTNLYKTDFYCNDVYELTTKICKANVNRTKKSASQTTELKLLKNQPRVSHLIEEMQHWLYTTSFQTTFQPEIWSDFHVMTPNRRDLALIEFLERLKSSFENTLPTIYYRLIGAGLVQLLQHLIATAPMCMTDDLIQVACKFFSNDKIRGADVPHSPTKDESKTQTYIEEPESSDLNSSLITTMAPAATTIYHALITAPFIESLGSCHLRYDKLKNLLFALIEYGVITLDFVNNLFVTVFKEELNPNVFNAVSKMLYELAQKSSKLTEPRKEALGNESESDSDSDIGLKSKLFMELLADFSRDLDDF